MVNEETTKKVINLKSARRKYHFRRIFPFHKTQRLMDKIQKKLSVVVLCRIAAVLMFIAIGMMALLSAVLIVPKIFGVQVFAVATGSMEPSYHVGSLVFTKKTAPEKIKQGDCITYQWEGETITHRVIRVENEKKQFITQGDQNEFEDPAVPFTSLIGATSEFSIPVLGYFVLWVHQIQYQILILIFSVVLAAFIGKKMYYLLKRRDPHEAKC